MFRALARSNCVAAACVRANIAHSTASSALWRHVSRRAHGAARAPLVACSDEVRQALDAGKPVVALESTIVSHGGWAGSACRAVHARMRGETHARRSRDAEQACRTHKTWPLPWKSRTSFGATAQRQPRLLSWTVVCVWGWTRASWRLWASWAAPRASAPGAVRNSRTSGAPPAGAGLRRLPSRFVWNRRDIAVCVGSGATGATTVAGTMCVWLLGPGRCTRQGCHRVRRGRGLWGRIG